MNWHAVWWSAGTTLIVVATVRYGLAAGAFVLAANLFGVAEGAMWQRGK